MKNLKFTLIGLLLIILLSGAVYFSTTSTESSRLEPIISEIKSLAVSTTEANPDYICIKQVEDAPCGDLDNPPWNGAQTRVRTGKRVTSVAYYSVRIGCAEGGVGTVIGSAGGASGRRSADFPYSYGDACTVIETDTVAPDANPTSNQ